jgi:hypothetical protein
LAEFHHDIFGGTDKTKPVKAQFRENCDAVIERFRRAKAGLPLEAGPCDDDDDDVEGVGDACNT